MSTGRHASRVWALALLVGALAAGCRGVEVREPPRAVDDLGGSESTCVDYPPPAAKVEELPAAPSTHAVWVDGEWSWNRQRWSWKPGGWTEPAAGARFVRSGVARQPNGALAWHPGHWQTEPGEAADAGATARATPGASASTSASASRHIECPRPLGPARDVASSPTTGLAAAAAPGLDAGSDAGAVRPDTGPTDASAAEASRPARDEGESDATVPAIPAIPAIPSVASDAGAPLIQPPP
jgi:hypothetical protein